MRNAIEYYYDIEVDDLIYKDGKYIFKNYLFYIIFAVFSIQRT